MTDLDRRAMLSALTATGLALAANSPTAAEAETMAQHRARMLRPADPDAPKVAMLVHPDMVALDLIGPMTVLKVLRCDVQLVWKDLSPVSTDVGLQLAPTMTFERCPRDLDVLFVPGGILGTTACMGDEEVLGFLADRGSRSKWVTSVCTGGLLLAAAGLLRGYDATAHWAVADLLPLMGARHVDERVVIDRNRMTGGGVTAGLDFGLTLAEKLRGQEAAKRVQLILEYSPQPPFSAGTPAEAGEDLTAAVKLARTGMDAEARRAAQVAARRLGIAEPSR